MGLRKHHYEQSGGDRIPAKLFQVLKDNAMKVLNSICHSNSSKCWKTQQWPQDWKRSVFIPKETPCQRMFKLLHNCTHFTCQHSNAENSPSQASTVCEPRTFNVQAGSRKGRGTTDQICNIHWIIRKAREFQKKTFISA